MRFLLAKKKNFLLLGFLFAFLATSQALCQESSAIVLPRVDLESPDLDLEFDLELDIVAPEEAFRDRLKRLKVYDGAGSSGGGDIGQLRARQALGETQLERLFSSDGRVLKRTAINLLKLTSAKEVELRPGLATVKRLLKEVGYSGLQKTQEDILNANLVLTDDFESGCSEHRQKSACAFNYLPGTEIVFNKQKLLANKVSFAELMGIFMHELSHWYIGHLDDKTFEAGAFFERAVLEGKHQGKRFEFPSALKERKSGSKTYYSSLFPAASANSFCKTKGMKKASSWERAKVDLAESANIIYFYEGRPISLTLKKRTVENVFTAINCE